MITVEEALTLIGNAIQPLPSETISLDEASGRVLANPVVARITHPPAAVSAMDGYAIALPEPVGAGKVFDVIGEAPAGKPFDGAVGQNAVRIFTGSVVPAGANHVVIQEDVDRQGSHITLTEPQDRARNIRLAGTDFHQSEELLPRGHQLKPIDLALSAAAGVSSVDVFRRPTIAIFANGDELVSPGESLKDGQIYNSIPSGLIPLLCEWGADPVFLGTAKDHEASVVAMFNSAKGADIVVPIGGASVGDHDLVKRIGRHRFLLDFEKVSVKPGKPVWFGSSSTGHVLGFPGNPASAFVCAHLFLRPALSVLFGGSAELKTVTAKLAHDLEPNGSREHFLRASMKYRDGVLEVSTGARQDSSLLSTFSQSNALLRRMAGERRQQAGDLMDILPL